MGTSLRPAAAGLAIVASLLCPSTAPAQRAVAARLTAEFASMNGAGWTGGDAAWSARLPDGRDVWLFGDTLLGGVQSSGRRDPQAPMVRNSIVVAERDGGRRTVVGGDDAHPQSLVPGAGPDDWYWPGPPVVSRSRLQVPMAHIVRTGPGGWDFKAAGSSRNDGAMSKAAFVARVRGRDLSKRWWYWDGSSWSPDPGAASPVVHGVSDQFSHDDPSTEWTRWSRRPLTSRRDLAPSGD